MKKLLALFLNVLMLTTIGACARAGDDGASTDAQDGADTDWDFYYGRAEAFITEMANGNFDAAHELFDATMKKLAPADMLERDVWGAIIAQAGEFVAVHEKSNTAAEGYYVCFITSRHERSGVTMRVVLSKDGLVAGLYVDGYPALDGEAATTESVQRNGFTDYPVAIGEGTDYPLGGILSMPDGAAGVPAVVLVQGSGPHDMDESFYTNKPFRDIAEYLVKNGIAVLRYDKRTFTHGDKLVAALGGGLTVREETIDDAVLAARLLKADERVDSSRVFILGHSLGGMLAPRIHVEGGDFAGIISLAGSPRSLLDIIKDQQLDYINSMAESDEKTTALSQMETYDAQVEALMSLSDVDAKNTPLSGGVAVYYFKEMDTRSVADYLAEADVPMLVLQGGADFQVYADRDFALWKELLAGRDNVRFELYEGLNHLFMPSTGRGITDFQEEYKVPGHVDKAVLRDIAEWINAN